MSQKWTNELLDRKRLIGDPKADALIAELVTEQGPAGARKIFEQLITNVEIPVRELTPKLQDFIHAHRELPAHANWEQVRKASELFIDHGPKFLLFLYYKSLPQLYLNAKGAVVLEKTSRLTHQGSDMKIFARRVAETGQFLLDVMAPGNLAPGGKGLQAIQKVRLIHASVRHFMPADQWDTTELGVPINQEDLAQTLMTFSISPLDTLTDFNVPESEERLKAYLFTWNYIGELLGVDVDLLPTDLEDARDLLRTIMKRQAAASEAGQLLVKALIEFTKTNLPTDFERTPELLMIHMIGREQAALLGVTTETGCLGALIPEFIKAYFNWGERLEDKLQGPLHLFIQHLARRTTQAMVNYFDKYKGRNFEIPESLQRAWAIRE
ncbi:oxygenase MpaB family protein [Flavilitoribacter nigricans]|uniref:ER-bound oxygenase mpaB/mpaB'/Rubber oxygenase catalytic domain-containing protein n=1 Tax=Flavilitoribacter nigricans (strain ATCC 23147 / DSM 23189 / NBRC 102662 / NCIMB 1420 / SS-2) TaxID=1122177 RepID=A0A2D0N5K6_FLAN2|nr:oxygenase MpaB family protein [Flavilitoribacter nigricans]PHN03670.1 hypothetical protein CRP01_25810 [Flavilitoribacter nigricans DSM 23189 = NBRC 102662]